MSLESIQSDAVDLLIKLIQTPSFSRQESQTAALIDVFLKAKGIKTERVHNNIIARSFHFDEKKPSILLNSHHDTVKVVAGWNEDPHGACIKNGKLFGLGSNDAGASLVGLISTFLYFESIQLTPFNLILIASAEEEIFGTNGLSCVVQEYLSQVDLAIVGEPTGMHIAISEKGLIVIDGYAKGKSGHAARKDGINAIDLALKDVLWINNYAFPKISPTLGKTLMTVTQIEAGYQHNVIPDTCHFVVDVRVNDAYTLQDTLNIIKHNTESELVPRSLKWHPSHIDPNHPIIQRANSIGMKSYGSPTLSDQVHLSGIPSVKIGIGESIRSHTPDEYIYLDEVRQGILKYIQLLNELDLS